MQFFFEDLFEAMSQQFNNNNQFSPVRFIVIFVVIFVKCLKNCFNIFVVFPYERNFISEKLILKSGIIDIPTVTKYKNRRSPAILMIHLKQLASIFLTVITMFSFQTYIYIFINVYVYKRDDRKLKFFNYDELFKIFVRSMSQHNISFIFWHPYFQLQRFFHT